MDDVTFAALVAPCFLAPFFLEIAGVPQRVCGIAGMVLSLAAFGLFLAGFRVTAPAPYGLWASMVMTLGMMAVGYRQARGWAHRKEHRAVRESISKEPVIR